MKSEKKAELLYKCSCILCDPTKSLCESVGLAKDKLKKEYPCIADDLLEDLLRLIVGALLSADFFGNKCHFILERVEGENLNHLKQEGEI
jgi:hypothetical protein